MADRTGIEWTDATWNPLRGCSRVSEGCKHCYAEGVAARFSGPGLPYEGLAKRVTRPDGSSEARWTGKVVFAGDEVLTQPLRWKRPRRVFVNSMSDLFHESVPDEWIDRIFAVMALSPQHTYQVLTKRPERMRAYLTAPGVARRIFVLSVDFARRLHLKAEFEGPRIHMGQWPLPNVWLGTSVEDQVTADTRIPYLLSTPAAVRFISAEPLLGPISLEEAWNGESALDAECWGECAWCAKGHPPLHNCQRGDGDWERSRSGLDWVIVGGESGPGARPMHPDWARSLRDQCAAAGVAFLFKQWGEWLDADQLLDRIDGSDAFIARDGVKWAPERPLNFTDAAFLAEMLGHPHEHQSDGRTGYRLGKGRAGRVLDGVTHDGFPEGRG